MSTLYFYAHKTLNVQSLAALASFQRRLRSSSRGSCSRTHPCRRHIDAALS